MALIRDDLRDTLWRMREIIGAACVALFGAWLVWLGGLILVPLGALVLALGAGLGVHASRRMRFAQPGEAPGVVEVVEGQVSFFGPATGGALSLADLTELRLLTANGRRFWRLKTSDNQALLIPVEALGADRLFDSFAALPGLRTDALLTALEKPAPGRSEATGLTTLPQSRVIWRRALAQP